MYFLLIQVICKMQNAAISRQSKCLKYINFKFVINMLFCIYIIYIIAKSENNFIAIHYL